MADKWNWHLNPDLADSIESSCLEQQFPSHAVLVC